MKNQNKSSASRNLLAAILIISMIVSSSSLNAQQFLTKIDGWNAYVHLPSDYNFSPSKKYPLILFVPGIGEVGTNAARLLSNGPSAFIAQGDSMVFNINGEIIRPIVISIQPLDPWPGAWILNEKIDSIVRRWRVDPSKLNVTGLSMGGWSWQNYSNGYDPDLTGRITSMVVMSAPEPDNSISNMKLYALAGGKWWGFEGDNDYRKMDLVRDTMNKYASSSARYYKYSGGHCCWNTWYNPAWHDADGESIYTWMLKQKKGTEFKPNVSPKAHAGLDKTIILPNNTTSLSGSGTDADGTIRSYLWTKISGPGNGKILSPNNFSTSISDLEQGQYKFLLTVTDDKGAFGKDTVQITVNEVVVDTSISLPSGIVYLRGIDADVDETLPGLKWTKISNPFEGGLAKGSFAPASIDLNRGYLAEAVEEDNSATSVAAAVDCGCDFTLPRNTDGGIYFTNGNSGINITPGKKVCISAGNYPYISITGLVGTASQPITIINCGGQVVSGSSSPYCYRIVNSQYFRFTGTGDPGVFYGFKAYWSGGFTGAGMSAKDGTSDWEIDHMETQNVQNGFLCKIDPYNCEPKTYSTGWTMKNISIHDSYVHNTVGEGMYVINTAQTIDVLDCNNNPITVEPVKGDGVKIYNNIVDSTGWDGIQVAAARHAQIYNNRITNYGLSNMGSQQAGLILGGKSSGSVYNNFIKNGTGEGMEIFSYGIDGPVKIYNNVLIHCGYDGTSFGQNAMHIDDRPQPGTSYSGLQVYIMNNTVVDAARNAITINNSYGTMATGNKIYNNLLVKPNNTSPYDNPYTSIGGGTNVDILKNVNIPVIANAYFVNPAAGNYHLLSNSPAINSGLNAGSYGVTSDLEGLSRPQGTAYDAGAYEYNYGTPPANQVPLADAGNDVVVALPVTSATLAGSGTDVDGTVSNYSWAKVSGPSGGNISSPGSATTTVTSLVQGIYKFALTITDNKGATDKDTVQVTENAAGANKAPTAAAGPDVIITLPTNSSTLAGSGSDADGTISSYLWTQISGPSAGGIGSPTNAQCTMSNLKEGVYVFQLKVTDNKGATATDNMQLTVKPAVTVPPGATKYIMVNTYGGSNPYNNSAWNNWNVGTGTSANITSGLFKYSDGTSSSVNSVLSYSQAIGDNGSDYQGGMAPKEVLRYTSYSQQARTLTVSGLSTSFKYNIELYASRWSNGNNSVFTINGTSITISTFRNFTNKATFTNIAPNSQGKIVVNIQSLNTYNYLNGFTLTQQGSGGARPALDIIESNAVNLTPANLNITNLNQGEGENYLNAKVPFLKSITSVEVFPNPVVNKVIMQITNPDFGRINVQIVNVNGVVKKLLILNHLSPVTRFDVPVNELPAGVYIIKMQKGNWSASKKIVKL